MLWQSSLSRATQQPCIVLGRHRSVNNNVVVFEPSRVTTDHDTYQMPNIKSYVFDRKLKRVNNTTSSLGNPSSGLNCYQLLLIRRPPFFQRQTRVESEVQTCPQQKVGNRV